MHILRPQSEANGPVLGPIISVEVMLEGHPVKALLDTGSPVTIASIECMLDALAKQRAPKQSVEEWKQEVQKKFQEPTLSVNNYGGGDVNVIGQLPVTLQVENKECQATILVQKGAKVDLLLGTDLISDLGFLVLEAPDQKGQSVDLLKRKTFAVNQSLVKEAGSVAGSCNTSSITKENSSTNTLTQSKSKDGMSESEKSEQKKTEEATQGSSTGVSKKVTEEGGRADLKVVSQIAPTEVRLLKAVRLPGWHSKIVTSSVPKTVGMGGFVLEPTRNNFSDEGVRVTEALVEVNQDNHVKVLIENHSNCPVLLEGGTKLGF